MPRAAWAIPRMWPGETAVVIGTGPSLTLAQLRLVALARLNERCRVIAVNDAVFWTWWADWLHACDFKWWNWHRETAPKFPGVRTTCTETVPAPWAHYLKVIPPELDGSRGGFAVAPDTVAGGGNGGYQAIQIAVKAGSPRVLLLGFDMKLDEAGRSHCHGEHPDRIMSDYANTMLPNFPSLAEALKRRRVEAINCTPGSALTCFPVASVEEALGAR
jgi:hypothetical protein